MELIDIEWRKKWQQKEITKQEAIGKIISGNRVFIGSGCSEPQALTSELIKHSESLIDTEIIHFLTIGPEKYFPEGQREDLFRHNAFFIGDTLREEVNNGQADYTPIYASEIPELFLSGRKYIDVALIQVSPPDKYGFCSFGINVDIAKPIAQSAYLTIAEINPNMPRTLGNSFIHMKEIDYYVYNDVALLEFEYKANVSDPIIEKIGKNIINLVQNKSTIHIGFGYLPNEILKYLSNKKDLGMHSHFITDNIIPLIENTVLTCRKKNFHPEKIITSFALGSQNLYSFIDNNPYIEFYPSDYVCNPKFISMNKNMISINAALQIDLTGQVNTASKGYSFYTGFGDTVDFMRGAAYSKGGKPIIALPSTKNGGKESRIVPHLDEGAGVILSRADIHYVVTEWGVSYIHGKTIRDRVIELISIAHPKFRQELLDEAKNLHYVYSDQILPIDDQGNVCIYPKQYETIYITKEKQKIIVRPLKTTDEPLLKDLYYSLNERDRYLRFLQVKKEFTHSRTQCEVNIDYNKVFSIGAFVGEIGTEEMIANATYYYNPNTNTAEFSFLVRKDWRGKGIGSFLYHHLIIIAKEKGIQGFYGNIHIQNKNTVHIIKKAGRVKITPPEVGEKELFYEVFFENEPL
ncbi:MAG: GNAT family N-acetyltransferase [Candidatus Lokiarchaeota archaeon]|nr:GNAT family N-acetyltransferase [Candidatus Lokiarchaeota archaeon]MBD3199051.1 GNAT family N-acetyltransferase [Candidatus Lokiarchaeota archaeon]